MFVVESGINKPFDRIAKELAEEAPRVFAHLLGLIPPGSTVELEPLRPESAPAAVMPDYVSMLRIDGGEPCLFHVEFFVRYRKEISEKMARYGGSLAWQYRLPVKSVVLLLSATGCPGEVPGEGVHRIGETTVTHSFRTVKLWELDPEPVLATNDPGLFSWALLMKLEREEAKKLGAIVAESGEERWVARFLALGGLRYDRTEVEEMLGGIRVGLEEAMLEGSSIVKAVIERAEAKAEARGQAEGKAEGKAEEARNILRKALGRLFPGLETAPEIDRIPDAEVLESLLLDYAIRTNDRDAMVHAILDAAAKYQ